MGLGFTNPSPIIVPKLSDLLLALALALWVVTLYSFGYDDGYLRPGEAL